jgi:putative membrane protein insertion efficiency factor
VRYVLIAALRVYRAIVSPLLPPACRFYPTCSNYAIDAIARYGALRGSWMAMRRLASCHPWHPGGVDFVPDTLHSHKGASAALPLGGAQVRSTRVPFKAHGVPDVRSTLG